MDYRASKVENLLTTFSNLLFINMKGMKHMNMYQTRFFRQANLNLVVTLQQMETQKLRLKRTTLHKLCLRGSSMYHTNLLPKNNYKS